MQSYIFSICLIVIFFVMKRNRVPALIMLVSIVVYISLTNNIESDKLYYIGVTIQEFLIGALISWHYRLTNYVNSKYIAHLSFFGVFIHIYGRLVYEYNLDTNLYIFLCLLVVALQISLMIIRPLRNGLYRNINRSVFLRFNSGLGKKPVFKMQTKHAKEEKCFQI